MQGRFDMERTICHVVFLEFALLVRGLLLCSIQFLYLTEKGGRSYKHAYIDKTVPSMFCKCECEEVCVVLKHEVSVDSTTLIHA